MTKDYYKVLGVDKNASKEEIKKAYKKLAKKYHPDLQQDESKKEKMSEKFKEISEAAAILGDDQKRQKYDQFGTADEQFQGGFGGGDFNFDDIFNNIFGGGDFFGGRRKRKGQDLIYSMEINLEDVAKGIEKHIRIPKMESCKNCKGSGSETGKVSTCSTCHGSGRIVQSQRTPFGVFQTQATCPNCGGSGEEITDPCLECKGQGVVEVSKKIKIKIPAGVQTGSRLRVAGEGEAEKGLPSGDLYIEIIVKPHRIFKRQDDNLIIESPISYTTAVLGGSIKVPTINGSATLKVPPGTQPGTVLRMRGKGLSGLHGGHGDQHVIINIEVPKKVGRKQKKLLEELEKGGWF